MGEVSFLEAFEDARAEGMRLYDLLMAVPRNGRVKVDRAFRRSRMPLGTTVGSVGPGRLDSVLEHLPLARIR